MALVNFFDINVHTYCELSVTTYNCMQFCCLVYYLIQIQLSECGSLSPKPENVVLHKVKILMPQHATKRPHRPDDVALLSDSLWPVGPFFINSMKQPVRFRQTPNPKTLHMPRYASGYRIDIRQRFPVY